MGPSMGEEYTNHIETMETMDFDNPLHPRWRIFTIFTFLLAAALGFVIWLGFGAETSKLDILALSCSIGLILSAVLMLRFYYWCPQRIIASDDGITLLLRKGKKKAFAWSDISNIHIGTREPAGLFQSPRESVINFRNDFRVRIINYDIAVRLKSEWESRKGYRNA